MRDFIEEERCAQGALKLRLGSILEHLPVVGRQWYRPPVAEKKRPGPRPQECEPWVREVVERTARKYPWWGYKRLAVVCRREGWSLTDRQVYRVLKELGLLQRQQRYKGEKYQAAKLLELLPQGPNELFQMDVTYIHIPGAGWWYAVTVIDYYSRYLLACHFTPHYRAQDCVEGLQKAYQEAERLRGPLSKPVFLVTDNGSSFTARRFQQALNPQEFQHVRIRYRTPTQLGLLERFHQTLKNEEVYWNLYESIPQARESLEKFRERYNCIRPHWSLIPQEGGDPLTPEDVYRLGKRTQLPRWQGWAKAAQKKLQNDFWRVSSLR